MGSGVATLAGAGSSRAPVQRNMAVEAGRKRPTLYQHDVTERPIVHARVVPGRHDFACLVEFGSTLVTMHGSLPGAHRHTVNGTPESADIR